MRGEADVMCVSTVKLARRHILIMTARSPFVSVDLQAGHLSVAWRMDVRGKMVELAG